jgi:hypothetical protein
MSIPLSMIALGRVTMYHLKEKEINMDNELRSHLDAMEARLLTHIDARIEKSETNLLTAFHGWARAMEIRVRGVSGMATGFDERLALVEERVSELERKKQ